MSKVGNNRMKSEQWSTNRLMRAAILGVALALSHKVFAAPTLSAIQIGAWLDEAKTGWFCWDAPTGCTYNLYTSDNGPSGSLSLINNQVLITGTQSFYFFGDWDRGTAQDTLTNLPWLIRLGFNGNAVSGFIDAIPGQQGIAGRTIENESGTLFQSNPLAEAYSGSLVFSDGLFEIELVDFNITVVDQTGWDRVSPFGLGANGRDDAVGLFTLRVTDLSAVPVPSPSLSPFATGVWLTMLWLSRSRGLKIVS